MYRKRGYCPQNIFRLSTDCRNFRLLLSESFLLQNELSVGSSGSEKFKYCFTLRWGLKNKPYIFFSAAKICAGTSQDWGPVLNSFIPLYIVRPTSWYDDDAPIFDIISNWCVPSESWCSWMASRRVCCLDIPEIGVAAVPRGWCWLVAQLWQPVERDETSVQSEFVVCLR